MKPASKWFFAYNAHVDEDGMDAAQITASAEYDELLAAYGYDPEMFNNEEPDR